MRSRSAASRKPRRRSPPGDSRTKSPPRPERTPKGKPVELAVDEHPRAGATIEGLRKLPLVFEPVDGVAGHHHGRRRSSGITDGGAAVVLATRGEAEARGLTPLARIVGWATTGVDPRIMGIGPVPAVRKLLDRTGLQLERLRSGRAERSVCAAGARRAAGPADRSRARQRQRRRHRARPSHRRTGTRIVVTLLHEMARRGARRGLATLCVSGGLGMAMALER